MDRLAKGVPGSDVRAVLPPVHHRCDPWCTAPVTPEDRWEVLQLVAI
ncbi:MAG TPA: hypothetical protein VFR55_01235 [Dehalococcoidia bacterium]|nr:hypothetical protein [Dehalococcoidia bacterium]